MEFTVTFQTRKSEMGPYLRVLYVLFNLSTVLSLQHAHVKLHCCPVWIEDYFGGVEL